jgi:hypothetical protein
VNPADTLKLSDIEHEAPGNYSGLATYHHIFMRGPGLHYFLNISQIFHISGKYGLLFKPIIAVAFRGGIDSVTETSPNGRE